MLFRKFVFMGMVPVMPSTDALPLERKPTTIVNFRLFMQIFSLTNRISFSHFEKKITHSNPHNQKESTPTQLFRGSNAQDPGSLLFLPRRHCLSPGKCLSSASHRNFLRTVLPILPILYSYPSGRENLDARALLSI